MPLITLTDNQMALANQVAQKRMAEGAKLNLDTIFNRDRMTPEWRQKIDLLGATAELAVSLFLDLPWTGKDGIGSSDVSGFEVRSTERLDGKKYWLLVREHDKDAIYVFCVVDGPNVVIAGWASAWQVRNNGVLRYTDTNCYGLSREQLNPMWQLEEVAEFASRTA